MTTYDHDLLVLGAGSGGVRAARIAASLGARVAVVEEARMGGTCVNVGCVPKKLLVFGSRFSEAFEDAAGFGWTVPPASFDWSALIAAKDREIARLNEIYDRMLRSAGVTIVRGRGVIIGAHEVRVGDRTLTAERILVATGGKPWVPDVPGRDLVITSDVAFALERLPARVVVVGGGYIGVEFAGIFASLGAQTTLVYRSGSPLAGFDDDVRGFLAIEMEKKGIKLLPDTRVACVERSGASLVVGLGDGETLEADVVMYATGRRANTGGLGLEEVGVGLGDRGGVAVNAGYQTSVPSIYAVGDVIDRVQLTPVALAEGMALARALYGGPATQVSYANIPTAVFSQPSVGTVGLTEGEARARGAVRIFKSTFRPMQHTLSGRDERTLMKLVVCAESDRVLGVHVVGPEAGEIVQGFGVALNCGATKAQLDSTIGIHPTAAEELVTMREAEPEPDTGRGAGV